ncbi:MAG: GspH/FimT family pseudopilin [Gemmatimonadetes bacterium]|nr:GspH/FimT family pseudopilin [Gemmatimonadota bacterium]
MRARPAFTLLDLVAVLAVASILFGVALPRVLAIADRTEVRHAADDVRTVLALARHRAVLLARPVAVYVDSSRGALLIGDQQGIMSSHPAGEEHGAELEATRDSVAFSPIGLGWGASNVSVIVSRGAAAETVTVSRAGRIR